jgi:flagellar hook-associated protein 2
VELHRASNTVTDAVDGVTFNLNQAQTDLTRTTTLTVAQDKGAASKAVQDVVDKFNQFYNDYKKNATFTQNADGTYTTGVFNMDMSVRTMVNQVSTAIMGVPTGISATAAFTTPAAIGLKTNQDGTLSLDSTALSTALDQDPTAVANLFKNSGSSSSPLLSFVSSTGKTTTSPINFNVTSQNGVLTGTFTSRKADGTTETNTLSSTDGYFYGLTGTALDGLAVQASAGATGTLQVATGISQAVQTLNNQLTDSNPGDIGGLISDLTASNYNLQLQINQQQDYLDRSKASLQKIYSTLETTVGQLQAAGQSLSGM